MKLKPMSYITIKLEGGKGGAAREDLASRQLPVNNGMYFTV